MKARRKVREPYGLRLGKRFQRSMRQEWADARALRKSVGDLHFEKTIVLSKGGRGRRRKKGRMDLFINDDRNGYVTVVEFKRTNWDRMKPGRLRPNALRHARQVWGYVGKYLDQDGKQVCPGITYAKAPMKAGRRALVEEILNGKLIQVVWRNDGNGEGQYRP